jgi:hypothetical protein
MSMNKPTAMKWLVVLAVAMSSSVVDAKPLGFDAARHLLNRTGFGASEVEIEAYAKLSREQAVSKLLAGAVTIAATPAPAFVDDPITPSRQVKEMGDDEKKEFLKGRVREGVDAGNVGHTFAAYRENDFILARPLRHQPAEGQGQPNHVSAERAVAALRSGQLWTPSARRCQGPGNADLLG